jgi:GH15 family glucan-1,4-alpha-glucosidase
MSSQHIEDYALIGDLRTGALVGRDGSLDWLSLPRFDSPSVFANLVGEESNGFWRIAPSNAGACVRRQYRDRSLVLETHWTTAQGAARVLDFMPLNNDYSQVVRIVEGLAGDVAMTMTLAPRMGYGRRTPALSDRVDGGVAISGQDRLQLQSTVALTANEGTWTTTFTISTGQTQTFTLTDAPLARPRRPWSIVGPQAALAATDIFWRQWAAKSTYRGPWEADVTRSLILLKALTYAPSGGIVAAATTSLPEDVGGGRNWDYRYAWLRDAAFTVQAFLAAGYTDEALAWRDWLVDTIGEDPNGLQIMYGVDGSRDLPEVSLAWLSGHRGSRPVRVGNGAARQQQNDVWGEVLDALAAARERTGATELDAALQRNLLRHLETSWAEPDHGLWEMRGPRRHFVHSKVMAWVGVDRAVAAAEAAADETGASGKSATDMARLRELRDTIHTEITMRGFKTSRAAFTQSYGSNRLDAAALLMPHYGFLPWTDPRVVATVEAVEAELVEGGFVRRYAVSDVGTNVDGVPGDEGVFVAASFWLVEALHGVGRHDDAVALFERLLALRNDVGLMAEEYDPETGHHLGNTPQAFSHAGLVIAAVVLSDVATSSITHPMTAHGHGDLSSDQGAVEEPA